MMASAALLCQSSCYALDKTFDCKSHAHAALSVQQCNGYNCTLGCGSTNYCDQQCDTSDYNCRLECEDIPKLMQDCNTGECDVDCHGQNCEQKCNTGASKCILRCNSKEQCTQECNHGNCDMECKGQKCVQKCNSVASKCSLQCHGNQHCMQTCNHGKCDMECKGQKCEQICNSGASECSLQCHGNQLCMQTCNDANCDMECHGQNCEQKCNSGTIECSLQCHSKQPCKQIRNHMHEKYALECHDPNCVHVHHCEGNQHSCQPKCEVANDPSHCDHSCLTDDNKCNSTAATMTKTTSVLALKTTSVHYHPCRHLCSGEWSNCSSFCYSGRYCLDITTRE